MNTLKVLTHAICTIMQEMGVSLIIHEPPYGRHNLGMKVTEKYFKILVMKNYVALVAKLQCRKLVLASSIMQQLGVTGIISIIMVIGQKRYKHVFTRLYLCYEAFF